jgi:hypothetical protein
MYGENVCYVLYACFAGIPMHFKERNICTQSTQIQCSYAESYLFLARLRHAQFSNYQTVYSFAYGPNACFLTAQNHIIEIDIELSSKYYDLYFNFKVAFRFRFRFRLRLAEFIRFRF